MNQRVALLLLAAIRVGLSSPAIGAEPDLRGSWQVNIDCEFTATASIFLSLDQDLGTGVASGYYSDCGTFEVPPSIIRRPLSCEVEPLPIVGQVGASTFDLPTAGFFTSNATIAPLQLFTCTAATRIVSLHHFAGTRFTTDDTGRVVTVAGVFQSGPATVLDAADVPCLQATPPACTFDMRRNDVPVGEQVVRSPRAGATVAFERITAPGTVGVVPLTDADGAVPSQFQVHGNGGTSIFYDVTTTATYEGTIRICLPYRDENGDGIVDGSNPPLDEDELRVLHDEGGMFVDRTTRLDTMTKVICASTTSLSQLAVANLPVPLTSDHPTLGDTLSLTGRGRGKAMGRFKTRFVGWKSAGDPTRTGATLEIFSTAQPAGVSLPMPADGWRNDGRGMFRFVGPRTSNAVSPVRAALINYAPRDAHAPPAVRIDIRAADIDLGRPQKGLAVRLTIGSARHCGRFSLFRENRKGRVVARAKSYPAASDCADKRMRWMVQPG